MPTFNSGILAVIDIQTFTSDGTGSAPGAGGGGGGAATSGGTAVSGAGGAGGNGKVVVWTLGYV